MTKNEPIGATKLASAQEPVGATVLAGGQVDQDVLRKTEEAVAFEWKPGDVILDLYEVRSVTEGFGEDAQEKNYHQGGFGRVYKVWHRTWRREMAVKTPRPETFTRQEQKDNFIRECETWINLGLHPHIATCHYVRELGGVPRVFSEYAAAGTLEEWIRSERLYAGDEQVALARILDLCIQFAWGLHYAHERGVIHQDVKPLNALMWDDGTLKVTDYGLAGARQKAGLTGLSAGLQTVMVSMGGMTPSHCSPEQAAGQMLDRRTDVWSWAVSVLEMFQGGVTWQTGSLAAEALEVFLQHGGKEEGIPGVPGGVADLLRRCFQSNPADRPRTLDDCAQALCAVYEAESGKAYHRGIPHGASDTPDALNNRGLSFIDLGKPDEAEKLFERALQLDKHHLAATYNRGLMQWRGAKVTDTHLFTSLEEIKKENPDDASVECVLGWLRMENADFAQAQLHFERAIKLRGDREARIGLEQSQRLSQGVEGNPFTFGEHVYGVHTAAFSPDGRFILTGSGGKGFAPDAVAATLRLWDVATGQCLRTFEGGARSVAFSPDGRFAISGTWAGKTIGKPLQPWDFATDLALWDLATGESLRTFKHTGGVESVAFSPDGRFALAGQQRRSFGQKGVARLWDVATGQCLRTFEAGKDAVSSLAFSPDGRFALAGDSEKLRLWDVATGECLRTFEGGARSVAYSPNGRFALSGYFNTLRLWEVATGQCLRTIEEASAFSGSATAEVTSVAFSPDGRFALSGSYDKTLRLWEVATGQCLRTFEEHAEVNSVAFSPDGRCVLSGSRDGMLRLRDVSLLIGGRYVSPWLYSIVITSEEALERQRTHNSHLSRARRALEAGQIGQSLALLTLARAVRGFERSPESLELQARAGARCRIKSYGGGWLKRTLEGHEEHVRSVVFSPDGRVALSGDANTIRLWDVATGEWLRTLKRTGGTDVTFSPDGRFALSGSHDLGFGREKMRLWDLATGQCLRTFEGFAPMTFSPDGRFALFGCFNTLRLWDVATGQCLRAFEDAEVNSVAFSPDGRLALSAYKEVRLWDVATGKCVRTFGQLPRNSHISSAIDSVVFSPDGRFVLSDSKGLQLWDVATGECLRTFEGHEEVKSLAFSPNGRFALSGGYDKTLRLWDVATGQCLRTFEGHTSAVASVAFSPDCRFALSGGVDKTLRLWEIDWEYEYDPKHDPVLTLKPIAVS